jgi:hypothetical protein
MIIFLVVFLTLPPELAAAKLQMQTVRAWDEYIELTEKRIAEELDTPAAFIRSDVSRLKNGAVFIQKLSTKKANSRDIGVPDGLIHHWFGSIFIPNVSVPSLITWVQNYDRHSQYFNEVDHSKLVSREGDAFKVFLRLVRKKVVTVHYNTDHTVVYRTHTPDRVSSRSFTTRIAEIENPGESSEKEKPLGDDSGFFWRLNSYWRFQAQDGGVIVECESVSLSRSIPFGLGWLIKGFVESVPRESLESTFTSIRSGL